MAEKGACNGTFTELELVFQSSINATRFHEKTGWRLRNPEQVSPRQIEAMQVEEIQKKSGGNPGGNIRDVTGVLSAFLSRLDGRVRP